MKYVSRKVRDGLKEGRTSRSGQHSDMRASRERGRLAHGRRSPRWANPLTAGQARAWTAGWNAAHLKWRKGPCAGCEWCGVGTKQTGGDDGGLAE
jgi:hypothetical protein